jgi:hypothetical protein
MRRCWSAFSTVQCPVPEAAIATCASAANCRAVIRPLMRGWSLPGEIAKQIDADSRRYGEVIKRAKISLD